MRSMTLLFLVASLAGCKQGDGLVVVTIDGSPAQPLTGLASLRGSATANGTTMQFTVPNPDGTAFNLPPSRTFGIAVPANLAGPFTLHVEALGGNQQVLASGDGATTVSAGAEADLTVTLAAGAGTDGGVDAGPDLACPAGMHSCNGACVTDDSVDHCGSSCTPCTVPQNGAAACTSGSCTFTCANGFHPCGTTCADNTSVMSCGGSCTPCPTVTGGTATCDPVAGTCGGTCPANMKLCLGACIPSANACNGTCPGGTHNCNGLCLSDTSTGSCGTLCTACPTPANGAATCSTAGQCGIQCNANARQCGNTCVVGANCCASTDCPSGQTCPSGGGVCFCASGTCAGTCSGNCGSGTVCQGAQTCVACGAITQPCCAGSACNGGAVCSGNSCVACGGGSQPCCPGSACNNGYICQSGTCNPCGTAPGVICCPGGPYNTGNCPASGIGCNTGTGYCSACGLAGEPCCSLGAGCTQANTACGVNAPGLCSPCGSVGNHCCGFSCPVSGTCGSNGYCQ